MTRATMRGEYTPPERARYDAANLILDGDIYTPEGVQSMITNVTATLQAWHDRMVEAIGAGDDAMDEIGIYDDESEYEQEAAL